MSVFKTKKRSNAKRGFTLVELCIVLAVLSLVAVMVYSFLPLVADRSQEVADMSAVSEDLRNLENEVNKFILHYDNNDFTFGFQGNTMFAYPKGGSIEDVKGKLTFDKNKKETSAVSYISGESDWKSTASFENLTSVSFSRANSSGSEEEMSQNNILIKCSVGYKDNLSKDEKSIDIVFVTHSQGEVVRKVEE